MRRLLVAVLVTAMMMPMVVSSQTTVVNVTWTWTAPTTGSAVHHYVVQVSSNATTWSTVATQPTTGSITLPCAVGTNVQIRVAAVDAQSRQGVYSEVSDPFVPDAGVPGAPGKPVRTP